MEDHPDQLFVADFTATDQTRLADFSCGNDVWCHHVAEWLRVSDVLHSMQRSTRVWLFENQAGTVVGIASLGVSRWRWPPPDGSLTNILLIPMLGIDVRFQGLPPDPDWKYARQIMSHMLAQARQLVQAWSEPSAGAKPE
jgi:hypothetical protein